MRRLLYATVFLCLVTGFTACDSEVTETPEKKETADTVTTDSTEIKSDTDMHTVTEAYSAWQTGLKQNMRVVGYIVGDYVGTQTGSLQLAAPFSSESNLILADDSLTTSGDMLFAVALKAGSEMRLQLNLKAHPELLHRRLVVQGVVETYFGKAGMRDVELWFLTDDQTEPVTPTPTPADTVPTDTNAVPIDTVGEVINIGRLPLK